MEETCVLDKLPSGRSYTTAGQELDVNESTAYKHEASLRSTGKARVFIDQLIKMI